jgi:hypothetical protein
MSGQIPVHVLQQKIHELRRERETAQTRISRIDIELELLGDLIRESGLGSTLPVADRYGPSDAIRRVAEQSPGGIQRAALRRKAKAIVTTDPAKADKVLDQTIRNLMGRDLEERDGLIFRVENTNGHPRG